MCIRDSLCSLQIVSALAPPLLLYVHQNTGSCFVVITWDCSNIPKGHLLFLQRLLFCFASLIICTVVMKGRGRVVMLSTPFRKLRGLLWGKVFNFYGASLALGLPQFLNKANKINGCIVNIPMDLADYFCIFLWVIKWRWLKSDDNFTLLLSKIIYFPECLDKGRFWFWTKCKRSYSQISQVYYLICYWYHGWQIALIICNNLNLDAIMSL